ncbi:hypothetical protein ACH5RR_036354 [Cinchona calisaya]|uniref:Bet v I/Major latex protein domain-containing protein n=1 Tax=Cinchona calisaya TaxID=153742 RepID=A0ABD2Y4V8_9GENT
MGLSGKLEFLQEVQSPGNVFLDIFGSKKDDLPKICPNAIPSIELLEGNWGDEISFPDGKDMISKETVQAVDKENQSTTYNFLEGDLMKVNKTMKVTFQVISKGEKNFLKWTYIYEKMNADDPDPDTFKFFASELTSMIDARYMAPENKI